MASVSLSHLSVELGHVYADEFGERELRRQFQRLAEWRRLAADQLPRTWPTTGRPRVSTCFFVDDYFQKFEAPAEVFELVPRVAAEYGVIIDYIARESGCASVGDLSPAELVRGLLVAEPVRNTTGRRPAAKVSGWLCNGQRGPVEGDGPAMTGRAAWSPPVEAGDPRHSIFVDVQLWAPDPEDRDKTQWSCAFLSAVWQLARLGVLRHRGAPVLQPDPVPADGLPDDWRKLPAVVQVNPTAAPFSAYRTLTLMDVHYLPVELAVRTILGQVGVDEEITRQVAERAAGDGVSLPPALVDRLSYLLLGN